MAQLYPCPCCGYQTLDLEPPGTYLICPICFWEDDGDVDADFGARWGGSNQVSLRQAQRNFLALGACEPQWLADVRSPTPADQRDPAWQPLDELAAQRRCELIQKIAIAFQDVVLGDGVSLHQARALDDYQDPIAARQMDAHIPWQEIPAEWIEQFCDVFPFMDAKGWQFAIPAYMTWCLQSDRRDANSFEATVMVLQSTNFRDRVLSRLNSAQVQVISEFLQFIHTFT